MVLPQVPEVTPRTLSPYMLIQEFLRDDPWRLFCAVQMLNLTSAKQVWPLLPEFFERWPDPVTFSKVPEEEVAEFIRPLGLYNRRAKNLKRMTDAYLDGAWLVPEDLPGIGKYGGDSYRIFVEGYLVQDVQDKELKNYVRWAREEAGRTPGDHDDDGGVRTGLPEGAQGAPGQG